MSKKLEKTIIKIIKDKLKTNKTIKLNSGPYLIDSWDSLKHVEILTALSKKFKIKISEQEFDQLFDVKSIVSFFNINEKK